jgi:hypothetical protein
VSVVVARLDAGLVIGGRVLTAEGEGVQTIIHLISEAGCGVLTTHTAADGSFWFGGLCRGPWRCHAGPKGWVHRSDYGWSSAPGDSMPLANSAPVLVTESREDVELVLCRSASMTGRCIGLQTDSRAGSAINRDSKHRYALRFDGEAFAATGLDPGTYMIVATDRKGWGLLDDLVIGAGGALADLEVRLEPEVRLSVSLPSEEARTSLLFDGVLLPPEHIGGRLRTMSAPAGRLDLEMRLGGSRQVRTIEAVAGQTVEVIF